MALTFRQRRQFKHRLSIYRRGASEWAATTTGVPCFFWEDATPIPHQMPNGGPTELVYGKHVLVEFAVDLRGGDIVLCTSGDGWVDRYFDINGVRLYPEKPSNERIGDIRENFTPDRFD
jgi:hypothetical protein